MLFFFNDTATTEIYTLSLHDALPICAKDIGGTATIAGGGTGTAVVDLTPGRDTFLCTAGRHYLRGQRGALIVQDRKSTRLNSSHANISYAVFCLKKKKKARSCRRVVS